MIKCQNCHREIKEGVFFCPFCGRSLFSGQGTGFEWKSDFEILGIPLIHIATGRDENGKLRVAKGIIAIGQFAIGLITIAQFGIGILFGVGQFMFGIATIAQFAMGILFGLGQFATGYIVIGQFAFGWYALCQFGFAKYIWSPKIRDPVAIEFFRNLWERILHLRP
ncbi:MAG: zinc ribbon domain-containing protein [candidate division WOR-3 bacterium]